MPVTRVGFQLRADGFFDGNLPSTYRPGSFATTRAE